MLAKLKCHIGTTVDRIPSSPQTSRSIYLRTIVSKAPRPSIWDAFYNAGDKDACGQSYGTDGRFHFEFPRYLPSTIKPPHMSQAMDSGIHSKARHYNNLLYSAYEHLDCLLHRPHCCSQSPKHPASTTPILPQV